jgi:uncharacterized membrane protein YfhO
LEARLKSQENYLVRLGKEKELNQIRQEVAVLQERLLHLDTIKVDNEKINRILKIQYAQIEKAVSAVQKKMQNITQRIIDEEAAYGVDITLAKSEKLKLKKQEDIKKANTTKSIEELATDLEDLKTALGAANTGGKKDQIRKQIDSIERSYPEGVYEDIISENNRTIKKVIVSVGGNVTIYKMMIYSWGGTFYFRDGVAITKSEFDQGTAY